MRQKNSRQVWDSLILVFQFSINMIVPILMCTLLGVWLGERFDINWIVIPLFFVGALAGGNNIYKMVRKQLKKDDRKERTYAKKNK